MATRPKRESLDAWFPTVLKWTGLLGTVLLALLWAVTATLLPPAVAPPAALLAAFGTMFGVGQGTEAIREIGHR